jgi:hypothetical protein
MNNIIKNGVGKSCVLVNKAMKPGDNYPIGSPVTQLRHHTGGDMSKHPWYVPLDNPLILWAYAFLLACLVTIGVILA